MGTSTKQCFKQNYSKCGENIRTFSDVLVPVNEIYKIEGNKYRKLLKEDVTKFYKTATNEHEINIKAEYLTTKLQVNNLLIRLKAGFYYPKPAFLNRRIRTDKCALK